MRFFSPVVSFVQIGVEFFPQLFLANIQCWPMQFFMGYPNLSSDVCGLSNFLNFSSQYRKKSHFWINRNFEILIFSPHRKNREFLWFLASLVEDFFSVGWHQPHFKWMIRSWEHWKIGQAPSNQEKLMIEKRVVFVHQA